MFPFLEGAMNQYFAGISGISGLAGLYVWFAGSREQGAPDTCVSFATIDSQLWNETTGCQKEGAGFSVHSNHRRLLMIRTNVGGGHVCCEEGYP
jgi:hypothetical protein